MKKMTLASLAVVALLSACGGGGGDGSAAGNGEGWPGFVYFSPE